MQLRRPLDHPNNEMRVNRMSMQLPWDLLMVEAKHVHLLMLLVSLSSHQVEGYLSFLAHSSAAFEDACSVRIGAAVGHQTEDIPHVVG